MKITDISKKNNLKPLKLSVREMPHLTIETNLTCNIRCRGCYNLHKTFVKPLSQVKSEIDLALHKRNLETLTLLGGEPTLHPDLAAIIRYVKNKNVICEMLTNGVLFLQDNGERLLDEIVQAGLDRIVLHVDAGQSHIHPDINKVRHTLFNKFEKRKIFFSLSITIYPDSTGEIPSIMKEFSCYRYFDGILSILEMDSPKNFFKDYVLARNPQLDKEYRRISKELRVEPSAYIPSSLDDDTISWLMFFYYINTKTHKTMEVSPEYNRLFRKLYRLFVGKHVFGITSSPLLFPFSFLFTCLVESILHPKKIFVMGRLIRNSRWLTDLRFHYILIQKGPEYNHEKNQIQMCYHCPDATIRNGKLTPVCAADLINPLEKDSTHRPIPMELYRTIYRHLEQI
jgi:hypothetical protein